MVLQITLKDVAAKAGVSTSTACRALRGDPRISETTSSKIKAVAERIGYRPDPLLSALSFRRRNNGSAAAATTLAYISNDRRLIYEDIDECPGDLPAMHYQEMCFEGAFNRARELGYNLEHFRINRGGLTPKRLSQILRARGIVGMCFAPIGDVRSQAMELDWARFSSASIGVSLQNPLLHRSSTHHFHGMRLCLTRIAELGYRRIGICLDEVTSQRTENMWLAAALLFGSERPQIKLSIRMLPRSEVEVDVQQNFVRWFEQEKPDAVIGSREVYDWLGGMGLRVPQQVGFASLNWSSFNEDFSGVEQCTGRIAAAAIDLVVEQMHKCEYGVPEFQRTVLIKGLWRTGATLRSGPELSAEREKEILRPRRGKNEVLAKLKGTAVESLGSKRR